jgi:hypothetical protein
VNTTIESPSPAEPQSRMKRPLPNLLVQGFQLGLRNWPFVVCVYAINLAFALLAAIPFATGLRPYLDHSLAAQRIAGTIDLTSLFELRVHLRQTTFFQTAVHTAGWLTLLQLVVLFVLFAGAVFVYVSAEPPRPSVMLRGGVAYFWRFVRAAVLAGGLSAVILGILLTARALLMDWAGSLYVERKLFFFSAGSGAVVLLAALLLRLWWDLVEVYIVRNAMDGERRVRQALLPALRLLFRYFFRAAGSFFLIGILGLAALAVCLYVWKDLISAHQVWIAFFLAQLGLFLLLAARFWQRGTEAALVMSADPPIVAAEESEPTAEEEDTPAAASVEVLAGLSEPTLRDLVLKLRTEPWGNPEAPPRPLPVLDPASLPAPVPAADPAKPAEPPISLIDRHTAKFPLGGLSPAKDAPPADSVEKPKDPNDKNLPPPRHGRPLP